jgi:single-strand selective monofunctional uracil DNA glycosylase
MTPSAPALLQAARDLTRDLEGLTFSSPVSHVYNPLTYAWAPFAQFTERYAGTGPKKAVFLGMNPGPWGMTQTGVPFGEIPAVRDWMGISAPVQKPPVEHPKRPIEGFSCTRAEVSGHRLWGWTAQRWGTAEAFFQEHYVINFCPLVWMAESGANLTPDKLNAAEMAPVTAACDRHLARVLEILQPEWAIGIGGFAEKQLAAALPKARLTKAPRLIQILHPSPASPAANRGWAQAVEKKLAEVGF